MYVIVSYIYGSSCIIFDQYISDRFNDHKGSVDMTILRDWMEQMKMISIFLICAQTLIHFRAGGTYVKYLRLLVSIMLLVLLMEPFARVFGFLESGELETMVEEFFMQGMK